MKNKIICFLSLLTVAALILSGCTKIKESEDGEKETRVVTEEVTDENGAVVTDEKGEVVTEAVTDSDGKVVTEIVTKSETEKASKSETTGAESKEETKGEISADSPIEKKDPNKAKLPEGISLGEVKMYRLEDNVSLEIEVTSVNEEPQVVDFSYLVLKLNDKTEIESNFYTVEIKPQRVVKCSLSVENSEIDLSIGRSVTVYYGNEKLGTAIIESFG